LNLRRLELEFQREKYLAEAEERTLKFQLEMVEKKAFIELLQKRS
jgi:hypothetical protein